MSDYFRAAYERARAGFSPEQWLALEPREITEAIYREMRRMDAEAVTARGTLTSRAPGETKE